MKLSNVLLLNVYEEVKLSEICKRLKRQFDEGMLSDICTCKWCKAFKNGWKRLENEVHSRRRRTKEKMVILQ